VLDKQTKLGGEGRSEKEKKENKVRGGGSWLAIGPIGHNRACPADFWNFSTLNPEGFGRHFSAHRGSREVPVTVCMRLHTIH
jgi:hypothetical protein